MGLNNLLKAKSPATVIIKFNPDLLLQTKLFGANKIRATDIFAISVFQYSFGVIHWSKLDLERKNFIPGLQKGMGGLDFLREFFNEEQSSSALHHATVMVYNQLSKKKINIGKRTPLIEATSRIVARHCHGDLL